MQQSEQSIHRVEVPVGLPYKLPRQSRDSHPLRQIIRQDICLMQKHSVSLSSYAVSIASHWTLLLRLVQREFTQRFRGSILGLAWAVVTPLLTALVYTFIFGTVFKAKWGAGSLNSTDFTLLFLAGL